jgi:hypothetical protein
LLESYYAILGVNKESSLLEVKNAFKKKSKVLHPDFNRTENANKSFIELINAYDAIFQDKQTKFPKNNNPYAKTAFLYKTPLIKREENTINASFLATIKYEEFIKSDLYNSTNASNTIANFILFLAYLTVIIGLPVIAYFKLETSYVIAGLVMNVALFPITLDFIRNFSIFKISGIRKAFLFLSKATGFQILIISILNCYLLFNFSMQTLITPMQLISTFVTTIIISAIGLKINKSTGLMRKRLISFAFAPLLINLVFVINSVFGTVQNSETYYYKNAHVSTVKGTRFQSLLILENNKYKAYPGIRFFTNYYTTKRYSTIRYNFKLGIFGMRVVSSYQFHPEN